MVTLKNKRLVITTDIMATNLPDLQNGLIRMMAHANASHISEEDKRFDDDIYIVSELLQALTLDEYQVEEALKETSGQLRRKKMA